MALERTFVMFKPDCMKKGVLGKVVQILLDAGLKPKAMKMVWLNDAELNVHYAHHKDKPFFPEFAKFMKSAPVVMSVWEGENAVSLVRELCGPTDSKKAPKGTIRGDFGLDIQENVIHASDSAETAKSEIERFFDSNQIFDWS